MAWMKVVCLGVLMVGLWETKLAAQWETRMAALLAAWSAFYLAAD